MAADLAGAAAMLRQAGALPTMIDFNFTEVMAWRKAKALLDDGAIGRLRHVAVNWNVENVSTRLRLKNWKTERRRRRRRARQFRQPLAALSRMVLRADRGLSARLSGLPDDPSFETNVDARLAFRSGAAGSFAMSCASYLGSGHRLEFYGEDGTLVLDNPTTDYMRGFTLSHARRPAAALAPVAIEDDPLDRQFPADGAHRAGVAAGRAVSSTPIEQRAAGDAGLCRRLSRAGAARRRAALARARAAGSTSTPERRMSARRILVTGGSRLHRLGAGEGAGQGRPRRARARRQFARRAAAARGRREGHRVHRAATSATPRRCMPRCAAWTRSIISPSSTARSSSTARRSWCSMSASRAWST